MKIKDLKEEHPAIYDRISDIYKEQGRAFKDDVRLVDSCGNGGFLWGEAIEGHDFWNAIDDGKFQVFYDRYPEHAKDPVKIEQKDWSKASDEELIAEAKRRYPKGTTIESTYGTIGTVTDGFFMFKGSLCLKTTGPSCIVYSGMMNRWAQIVSQPEQEKTQHERKKEADILNGFMKPLIEPKDGDMVEVLNPDWRSGWIYLGLKNTKGHYICEDTSGKVQAFERIRLWKSEAESKAKELLVNVREGHYNHVENPHMITKKWLVEKMVEIAKWGQQNPTKK